MEKQDSNSGEKTKLPKGFKKIIRNNSLVDSYRLENKDRVYTYFQIKNYEEIKSRLVIY